MACRRDFGFGRLGDLGLSQFHANNEQKTVEKIITFVSYMQVAGHSDVYEIQPKSRCLLLGHPGICVTYTSHSCDCK